VADKTAPLSLASASVGGEQPAQVVANGSAPSLPAAVLLESSETFGDVNGGALSSAQPSTSEWKCELCHFLNHRKAKKCAKCQNGLQARSMVGRRLRTSDGLGTVAKASGKGWVVVETDNGAAHKIRLANIWDFVLCADNVPSDGGATLHIPALAVKTKGGPKNWSHAMLNKRVKTRSKGEGVVQEVIEKGWIVVGLDKGGSFKTRPGMVDTIDKDDVVSTFATKTKAGASKDGENKKRQRSAPQAINGSSVGIESTTGKGIDKTTSINCGGGENKYSSSTVGGNAEDSNESNCEAPGARKDANDSGFERVCQTESKRPKLAARQAADKMIAAVSGEESGVFPEPPKPAAGTPESSGVHVLVEGV